MIFQKNQIKKVSNYYKINGFVIIKNFFSNNMIIKKLNKQNLPNSEFISKNGFYIPSGLGIKLKQQKYVVDKIEEVINENF